MPQSDTTGHNVRGKSDTTLKKQSETTVNLEKKDHSEWYHSEKTHFQSDITLKKIA